jgi:tRNA(adenine34) deaminase
LQADRSSGPDGTREEELPGSRSSFVEDPALPEDREWMGLALEEARAARALGEVPVGAVIVRDGMAIASGHNLTQTIEDPSAHAEMIAIRNAAEAIGHWRLLDCTLYVTLEPCTMCAGAIVLARISRLVFGAWDSKAGMCGSLGNLVQHPRLNHRVRLTSEVRGEESSILLKEFFRDRREAARRARSSDVAP